MGLPWALQGRSLGAPQSSPEEVLRGSLREDCAGAPRGRSPESLASTTVGFSHCSYAWGQPYFNIIFYYVNDIVIAFNKKYRVKADALIAVFKGKFVL